MKIVLLYSLVQNKRGVGQTKGVENPAWKIINMGQGGGQNKQGFEELRFRIVKYQARKLLQEAKSEDTFHQVS